MEVAHLVPPGLTGSYTPAGADKPNPYFANPDYKFVTSGSTGVPQGPALWNHVFRVNQDNWNLQVPDKTAVQRYLPGPD